MPKLLFTKRLVRVYAFFYMPWAKPKPYKSIKGDNGSNKDPDLHKDKT